MIQTLPTRGFNSIVAICAVIALSAACLLVPIDVQVLEQAGYAGVFVITLLTTGALVLPVPYLAVIARAATVLDPVTLALVAGVAAALGELTGYILGRSGRSLVPDHPWARKT